MQVGVFLPIWLHYWHLLLEGKESNRNFILSKIRGWDLHLWFYLYVYYILVKDPSIRQQAYSVVKYMWMDEFCKRRNWDAPSSPPPPPAAPKHTHTLDSGLWRAMYLIFSRLRLWSAVFPGVLLVDLFHLVWRSHQILLRSQTGRPPPFSTPGKNCGEFPEEIGCSPLPLPPWEMEKVHAPPGEVEEILITFW